MTLSRARASEALARVENDSEARAAFLAAYTGDEDAVAALREVADPAQPSTASVARDARLKEWQRVAYARTETTEEEDAAARASDEIAWEENHRASIAAAVEAAVARIPAAAPEPPAAAAPEAPTQQVEAPQDAKPKRSFTVPVVIAVAVVGIAVGAIVTSGALASKTPTAVPTVTPVTSAPADEHVGASITRTYTTKQVTGWFAATAESADTFPQPNYLNFIGLHDSNTRFVTTQSTGWSLWVGKSTSGVTCLLINGTVKTPTTSLSNCLPAAAIGQGKALVINSHGINATLTKRDLVVAISQG